MSSDLTRRAALLPSAALGAPALLRAQSAVGPLAAVRVTDYGADPTGFRDSTASIRHAANVAERIQFNLTTAAGDSITTEVGAGPAITFPPGRYKVSGTIEVPGYCPVVAEAGATAILEATGPIDVLVAANARQNRFEGLAFLGGRTHILVRNRNIDQTQVVIRDCRFYSSSGEAIRAVPELPEADHLSAYLRVEKCVFSHNRSICENYCDLAVFDQCWITLQRPLVDGPQFKNRIGALMFNEVLGIPGVALHPPPVPSLVWVENASIFHAVRTHFGNEGGGIPILRQLAGVGDHRNPRYDGRIVLDHCMIGCGAREHPEAAVIDLHAIPEQLIVRGCYLLARAPLIREASTIPSRYRTMSEEARASLDWSVEIPGGSTAREYREGGMVPWTSRTILESALESRAPHRIG